MASSSNPFNGADDVLASLDPADFLDDADPTDVLRVDSGVGGDLRDRFSPLSALLDAAAAAAADSLALASNSFRRRAASLGFVSSSR